MYENLLANIEFVEQLKFLRNLFWKRIKYLKNMNST